VIHVRHDRDVSKVVPARHPTSLPAQLTPSELGVHATAAARFGEQADAEDGKMTHRGAPLAAVLA
jgi:hypothetical protein